MDLQLNGKRALVTGASRGIGRAIAETFAEEGAALAICARGAETLDKVAADLRERGATVYAEPVDVTDHDALAAFVDRAAQELGGLDVVVNNAGVSAVGTVEETDDEEWARVLDINVVGIARVTAAALPWLRRSEHAAVVNVCSIAALNGLPQRVAYSATKGAVLAMTYAMATDHVREGIRINCVSPGTVSTPFVERMLAGFDDPAAERAALEARQPTGRMVTPDEVAAAIAYLASPLSLSTTGIALEVDGGIHHLRVR